MNTGRKSTGNRMATRLGMLGVAALVVVVALAGLSPASAQGPDEDYPLRQKLVEDLIGIVTAGTGLNEADLLHALLSGQSLKQTIEAQGANVEALSAQLNAAAVADVNAAVSAGALTQAQADTLLGRIDTAIERVLGGGRGRINRAARLIHTVTTGALVDAVVHQTGLAAREVHQALREGKTLAEIAAEHGADTALVVSRAVERVSLRVNSMVERGRLTQAQADTLLNGLQARFQEQMNQPHPFQKQAQ